MIVRSVFLDAVNQISIEFKLNFELA